jgi:hypothetical protein
VGHMPPLPAVPGVIKVSFKQSFGTDVDVLNRCFFAYTGTTTQVSLGSMATTLAAAWHSHVAALQNTGIVLNQVECVDLTSDSAPIAFADPGTTGGTATNPLSAGVAAVLQFEINRRYRGGKPKMFLSAIPYADLANVNQLSGAAIANFIGGWLAFTAAALVTYSGITVVTEQVNVSYYSGFTNGVGPTGRARIIPTLRGAPLVDPVVGISMNSGLASQRRRNETP